MFALDVMVGSSNGFTAKGNSSPSSRLPKSTPAAQQGQRLHLSASARQTLLAVVRSARRPVNASPHDGSNPRYLRAIEN